MMLEDAGRGSEKSGGNQAEPGNPMQFFEPFRFELL